MVLNANYSKDKKRSDSTEDLLINSLDRLVPNREISSSLFLTSLNDFSNWSRLSSLWPLLYGTSCCFIEFASLIGSRFDFDRYGLVPRSSPRQADLIITAGTINMKMAPSLVRLYEQMPYPKYVIAMGACTITGGMFSTDSYSTVRGVDKLIPVDVYLPGCPPKPEAIIDAVTKLRKKIAQETFKNQTCYRFQKRYFSLNHRLCLLSSIDSSGYSTELVNQSSRLFLSNFLERFDRFENRVINLGESVSEKNKSMY
uniref:NADH dehydrogenase subunit K n=1 Tax=Crepidomanes latealatum TaxID=164669 RepID=UPI0023D876E3|nr:NADH dehydrogenase subunit K [Crepidomanes latealatum]WDE75862.1 NADH dehydrogenase subunit K [Crepidomanes latealatum]